MFLVKYVILALSKRRRKNMFLGFDDSLKFLKRELKDAGVDVSFLRQWQKC